MFAHILVPLDGSNLAEVVLPHMVAVARGSDARLTLLRVLDPVGAVTRPRQVDPFDWQIRKAEAEAYLRDVARRLEDAGLRPQVEIIEGKAAESVIEFARIHEVDLIALSSHGQSGISGWNVSSVVQKIIMNARKSILIVRAYKPPAVSAADMRFKRILVPLDGSQRAEVVLPLASDLVRAHDAALRLVHVVEKPEIPHRTPLPQDDLDLIDRLVERKRVGAARYMDDIKTRLDLPVESSLLVDENVSAALHGAVEQDQADLVLLSAHGYSGSTRWPYGSVVVSFIAYGTTPLLIFQDLPSDRIETTPAELAAREQGGR